LLKISLILSMNSKSHPYAEVVFPIPVDHTFTYLIPDRFLEDVEAGVRVLVPFGPRKTTGFIVGRKKTADYPKIREIEEILDPVPLFTREVLDLARWIAEYYLCGWGEVLKAALPAGIHLDSEKVVRLVAEDPALLAQSLAARAPRQAEIIRLLAKHRVLSTKKLEQQVSSSSIYSSLRKLRQLGYVRMELALPKAKVQKKYEIHLTLAPAVSGENSRSVIESLRDTAPRQARCVEIMTGYPETGLSRAVLCGHAGASTATVNSLVEKGYLVQHRKEIVRDYYGDLDVEPARHITLNPDQKRVLESIFTCIDKKEFTPFLLHGVTGSGKTQVYIEAIYRVLQQNRTAIVLVPEIALTPQMVRRFRSHFGHSVAVFHSRMSPGERYDSWRQTWEGHHRIVIGPRSAIFAPLKNVGLVVIDEEHESSYKQADLTPRYHARDVAVMRGSIDNSVVILGSATPAVESFFNAQAGKYKLLRLPSRIDDIPMPEITIQDMRREPKIIGRRDPIIISKVLREKIDEKLTRGEQIILLQNRRGFAPVLKCQDCGYTAKCRNCDISLTYHLAGRKLKCHYCDYLTAAPDYCPDCRSTRIFLHGVGTQRVEEELNALFPGIDVVRMDLDTTRGKRAHDRILARFGAGEYQILLGTQMVAKGLDFPNVTLVGVISADTQLLLPDYRAGERTFQLLTQVAGRAGRKAKQGEVVIQTYSPDEPSILFARIHNYVDFFRHEVNDRARLGYPPFSRMIRLLFKGENELNVQRTAERYMQFLGEPNDFKVLGPAPAPLSKIQGNFRHHILFMSIKKRDSGARQMKSKLNAALNEFRRVHRIRKVSITVDVDPVSIL
jgi:primosomal protein N' (replication factor Y)